MDSETAPSTSPGSSSGHTALAAGPIATGTQHVCFICLLNDTETPDASWVNPCPCTLEAHEECMLRWVAETEQSSSRPKHGLRCPACNAHIRVDEPYDSVVYIRDRLHRAYSRTSPLILLTLVLSGGIAGSGWYGLTATHLFAGPDATARWLGLQSLVGRPSSVPLWRWMPFWKLNAKIWVLSLIAPVLTFCRALQPLGNLVMIPSSILSAVFLISRDDMPSWPLSPAWAMTLFPFLQFTYSNVYYEFFGSFEKRLNRALRGRPAEEQPQPARLEGPDGQALAAGQAEEPDEGLWATLWGLGHAVVGLFGDDHEVVLEAEIHVGGHDHELDDEDEAEIEAQLVELQRAVEAEGLPALPDEQGDDPVEQEDDPQVLVQDAVEPVEDTGEPPQPEQDHPEDQLHDQPEAQPEDEPPAEAQNHGQNNQGQAPPAEENRTNTTLTDIVNNIVTSLLYPTICFGMGELLHATLPRRWVTRPAWGRPTGLLQQRWGRSLAGGCLYVVLKDAFVLYAKYRRVQVKQNRKVRNVEKRR